MKELEIKQVCWAYLIEHGNPTTGRWSYYGGSWDHVDSHKAYNCKIQKSDRDELIKQVREIGVNWSETSMPEFDLRSEFVGTDSPSQDTRTMLGTLVLNNKKSILLGCEHQPDYLEELAESVTRIKTCLEGAVRVFGISTKE